MSLDEFKSSQRRQAKKAIAGGSDGVGEGSGEISGDVREQGHREEGCGSKERRERQQLLEGRIQSNPTSLHYLQWKENTLGLAKEKLVES